MPRHPPVAPPAEDAIRARAYLIWEEEGRPEGRHEIHWQRALEWYAGSQVTPAKSTAPAQLAKSAAPDAIAPDAVAPKAKPQKLKAAAKKK